MPVRHAIRRNALPLLLLTGLLVALFVVPSARNQADATHEPANKVAAAGSDIRPVDEAQPVLTEVVRVDTRADLMLYTSSECSILTQLSTNGNQLPNLGESDGAFGQVKMFITIDGNRVPVSTDDTPLPPAEESDATATDFGEVVFCNRAYQRTVQDTESSVDGHDRELDFIRTRTANAFNWLALDVGTDVYDVPTYITAGGTTVTGNNVVAIELWAEHERRSQSTPGLPDQPARCAEPDPDGHITVASRGLMTCAEAMIGSRTLIVEPTHASVHELPEPAPNVGN